MDHCQGQASKVAENKNLKMENKKVDCIVQLCSKSSFVYTTRLEDMKILRKKYKTQSFVNIVEAIIAESKPSPTDNKTCKVQSNKSEITSFEKLTIRGSRIYKLSKSRQKQFTKEENDACNEDNSVSSDMLGIEDIKPFTQNDLFGMCKPLRVVLVDIFKNTPKKIVDKNPSLTCNEVLYVSSDDESDDRNGISPAENIVSNKTSQQNVIASQGLDRFLVADEIIKITAQKSSKNYVAKSLNDFKEIMEQGYCKNSLIIIYNKFLGDIDAFEFDDEPSVVNFTRVKNVTSTLKSLMKNVKAIFNIVACCWNIRYSYLALITNYTNYSKVARSMYRRHPCIVFNCKCCCKIPENIFYGVKKKIHNTIAQKADYDNEEGKCIKNNISKMTDRNNIGTKEKMNKKKDQNVPKDVSKVNNFIKSALRFPIKLKKDTKYKKGIERVLVPRKSYIFKLECNKLFKLSYAGGIEEIYELGYHNNMIGKITNDGSRPISSWISKTYSSLCDFDLLNFKEETSLLPSYISCFSCIDTSTKISFVNLNERVTVDPQYHKPSKKEYITTLTQNKKDNETSIHTLPKILDETQRPHDIPSHGKKRTKKTEKEKQKQFTNIKSNIHDNTKIQAENSASNQKTAPECLQPKAVTEDTTNIVSLFIDNIMKRFGKVRLTINAQCKVAAAFDSPVNNLNSSELKILHDILTYAQEEVDKLGLKPGMSLNAEKLLPNTFQNKMNAESINLKILNENEVTESSELRSTQVQKNQIDKPSEENVAVESNTKISTNEEIKNQVLLKFSELISEKKKGCLNSFRQYLGQSTDTMPKISNVFSLKNNSPGVGSGSKNTQATNSNQDAFQPNILRKTTKNKIDLESTAGSAKRRKRQNVSKSLDDPVILQKKSKMVPKSKVLQTDNLTEPDSLPKDGNLINKTVNSNLQPESFEVLTVSPENSPLLSSKVSDTLDENSKDILKTKGTANDSKLRSILTSKRGQKLYPTIVID